MMQHLETTTDNGSVSNALTHKFYMHFFLSGITWKHQSPIEQLGVCPPVHGLSHIQKGYPI